jgi:hypothetical protein
VCIEIFSDFLVGLLREGGLISSYHENFGGEPLVIVNRRVSGQPHSGEQQLRENKFIVLYHSFINRRNDSATVLSRL